MSLAKLSHSTSASSYGNINSQTGETFKLKENTNWNYGIHFTGQTIDML